MCDLTSLDLQEDLVAADDVRIQGYSELYQVTYNPGQKWCYLHEQRDSELLIFRTADSDLEGGGKNLPFTAPIAAYMKSSTLRLQTSGLPSSREAAGEHRSARVGILLGSFGRTMTSRAM